jgi:hypothetical protein
VAVNQVRRGWTRPALMNRISFWFSDLGHHDAAGPRAHGHHGGDCHVDDDDDGGLGMMPGLVSMLVMVLSLVLVPRLRPIRLTGRI